MKLFTCTVTRSHCLVDNDTDSMTQYRWCLLTTLRTNDIGMDG